MMITGGAELARMSVLSSFVCGLWYSRWVILGSYGVGLDQSLVKFGLSLKHLRYQKSENRPGRKYILKESRDLAISLFPQRLRLCNSKIWAQWPANRFPKCS